MKAIFTPAYGPATILETREVPTPAIGDHEVLVEVRATPVTAGDRRLRGADFPAISVIPGRLMMGVFRPKNAVQGTMFAGRVVTVGDAVTRYAPGDDVFGSVDHGAYAEYLAVSEDAPMAKMPDGYDYDEAAEVPYGGVTALRFLRDLAEVAPGERVLILGASGGVGRYAVQLAKYFGAEVTAVASGRNEALVRELGADDFIDYTREDWRERDASWDVIFDIADTTDFANARHALPETGRYLTLFMSLGIFFHTLMTSLFGGPRALFGIALQERDDIEYLRSLMAGGVIRPVVAHIYDVDEIAKAHAVADRGRTEGAVIVNFPKRAPSSKTAIPEGLSSTGRFVPVLAAFMAVLLAFPSFSHAAEPESPQSVSESVRLLHEHAVEDRYSKGFENIIGGTISGALGGYALSHGFDKDEDTGFLMLGTGLGVIGSTRIVMGIYQLAAESPLERTTARLLDSPDDLAHSGMLVLEQEANRAQRERVISGVISIATGLGSGLLLAPVLTDDEDEFMDISDRWWIGVLGTSAVLNLIGGTCDLLMPSTPETIFANTAGADTFSWTIAPGSVTDGETMQPGLVLSGRF